MKQTILKVTFLCAALAALFMLTSAVSATDGVFVRDGSGVEADSVAMHPLIVVSPGQEPNFPDLDDDGSATYADVFAFLSVFKSEESLAEAPDVIDLDGDGNATLRDLNKLFSLIREAFLSHGLFDPQSAAEQQELIDYLGSTFGLSTGLAHHVR